MERTAQMLVDERGDRLRCDPRLQHFAAATAKLGIVPEVAYHLVGKGKADHLPALLMGDAGDGGNECRLAGARDPLDHHRAVVTPERQGASGDLLNVEWFVAGSLSQACRGLAHRNHGWTGPLPSRPAVA